MGGQVSISSTIGSQMNLAYSMLKVRSVASHSTWFCGNSFKLGNGRSRSSLSILIVNGISDRIPLFHSQSAGKVCASCACQILLAKENLSWVIAWLQIHSWIHLTEGCKWVQEWMSQGGQCGEDIHALEWQNCPNATFFGRVDSIILKCENMFAVLQHCFGTSIWERISMTASSICRTWVRKRFLLKVSFSIGFVHFCNSLCWENLVRDVNERFC